MVKPGASSAISKREPPSPTGLSCFDDRQEDDRQEIAGSTVRGL